MFGASRASRSNAAWRWKLHHSAALATVLVATDLIASPALAQSTPYVVVGGTLNGASPTDSAAIGSGSSTTGSDSTAVGGNAQSGGVGGATAVGANANASATDATALGASTTADASNAVAIGNQVTAGSQASIAISGFGGAATVIDTNSAFAIDIGANSRITNSADSIALGLGANVNGSASGVAIGNAAAASGGANALAFGPSSVADGISSVALGATAKAIGNGAEAFGAGSNANGNNAVAIGNSAKAPATHAVGIGPNSSASGGYSTAIGDLTIASGSGATAIGGNATAAAFAGGANAVAIGAQSSVNTASVGGLAIGLGATTTAAATLNAMAIGVGATAANLDTMSVGESAIASGQYGAALGYKAAASATGSTAIGGDATAGADAQALNSIAIGGQSSVTANAISGIAIGVAASASGGASLAIGDTALANNAGDIAIGENAMAGTPGGADTQDVAIGVGASANGGDAVSIGAGNQAYGNGAVALGDPNYASGQGVLALGHDNIANADGSMTATAVNATQGALALGYQNTAIGQGSLALGNVSTAGSPGSIALGDHSVVTPGGGSEPGIALGGATAYVGAQGPTVIAVGQYATAGNPGSNGGEIAIGGSATAQNSGTAVGESASSTALLSVAVGFEATANNAYDVALGSNSTTQAANPTGSDVIGGVTYSYAGANPTSVVSVGSFGSERQITNVAAGQVTSLSTDAINGSQLFATDSAIDALSAGALVQQVGGAPGSGVITVGAATGGSRVDFTGTAGARLLTGLSAGALSPVSADAVNGSQLYATNQTVVIAQTLANQVNNGLASAVASFGAGANYDVTTGAYIAPSFTVQGASYSTVGGAFGAVDSSLTTISANVAINTANIATNTANIATNTTDIVNLSNEFMTGGGGIVQQVGGAPGSGAITVGAATGGSRVDFTGTAGARLLTGLSAGALSPVSADAVNGSQLYATNQTVVIAQTLANQVNNGLASAVASFGAGASYDVATGAYIAPSFTVQGASYSTVGGAFGAVDSSLTTISANVAANTTDIVNLSNELTTGGGGLVQQIGGAPGSGVITVGAGTGGSSINLTGTAGARLLTGLGAGAVSPVSADAVNGSQLYATDQNVVSAQNTAVSAQTSAASAQTLANQVNTGLASAVASFGGGASYDVATGVYTAPSFTVQGAAYSTVGGAVQALDRTVSALSAQVVNNTSAISILESNPNSGENLVQQTGGAPGAGQLTVGADTGGVSVSIAGTSGTRTLTGVGPGGVGAASVDAVNGSQLYAVQQVADGALQTSGGSMSGALNMSGNAITNVATPVSAGGAANKGYVDSVAAAVSAISAATGQSVANNLGGGSTYDAATGAVSAPAYTVGGKTYGNVGAAIAATNALSVQYAPDAKGSPTNTIELTGAGNGAPVTVSNVAAGVVSSDAVNVGQLNTGLADTLSSAKAYTDNQIAQVNLNLSNDRRNADGGVASAMATSQIPQPMDAGASMVGLGIATWEGQQAFAVGLSHAMDNGRVVFKAAGTYNSSGQGGAAAGVGIQF